MSTTANELPQAWKPFAKPPETSLAVPLVTNEQLDLIKRTVAKDATTDELKLYLYDCSRQGVHPLDKLIHFTKRAGKYTPITSIDFMRTRAADSGEYAGNDDAAFVGEEKKKDFAASVTVYRMVQGVRCAFTSTARWTEYKPASDAFMWEKMPHTMLAKCAEALALRKGFPRQLAGLYAKEEMDQAGPTGNGGYTVQAPPPQAPALPPAGGERQTDAGPSSGDTARSEAFGVTQHGEELPADGLLYISRVDKSDTKNKNVKKYLVTFSDARQASTINDKLAALCEQLCQDCSPVRITTEDSRYGLNLSTVERVKVEAPAELLPLTADDIAF